MQTILLLGAAYLLLAPKPAVGQQQQYSAPPPPPQQNNTGTDLGAAFGAFVGGLINQATSGEKSHRPGFTDGS